MRLEYLNNCIMLAINGKCYCLLTHYKSVHSCVVKVFGFTIWDTFIDPFTGRREWFKKT